MRPSVFLASSSEGLPVSYALQTGLDKAAEITVWTQNVFSPSQYILESLLKQLAVSDFGVFVFSPDDVVRIRWSEQPVVRDNVVFELGLFIGRLGRERSIVVAPRTVDFRLPTDLLGITLLDFDAERRDGNLLAALGPANTRLRSLFEALGPAQSAPQELSIPFAERRDLLTARQRILLDLLEDRESCGLDDLKSVWPELAPSELYYRLEQLRLLMLVTRDRATEMYGERRYRISDAYRAAMAGALPRYATICKCAPTGTTGEVAGLRGNSLGG